ncbi:cache domain-containing sensor histidine kinase [Paenibacillus sp. y28]|uniref:cache domain-containing sensor histidine kinase n=1 Tax=Paenibacillus sp. y28 TaxID=3129110 RepID=UPI003017925B
MWNNPFKSYRIDAVFFFSFAGFIAVLFAVVIGIGYSSSSGEIAQTTSYYQQRVLNELNKKLNTSLIGIEQTSNTAAKNFDVLYSRLQNGDAYDKLRVQSEMVTQLNYFVYGTPIIQSIHFYMNDPFVHDLQGPVRFVEMEQIPGEAWYRDIKDSDYAWLGEHVIETNNGSMPVISFARKVYNNSNQYYALLVMNIRVSAFQALIATEGQQSRIALLDTTGKQITHTGGADFMGPRLLGMLEQGQTGSMRLGDQFFVWSRSADSRWTLVELTSWKQMTQGSLTMAHRFLLLGLSAILLILLASVIWAKQLMRPIRQLLRAMNSYSPGVKQDDLPADYRNEFGGMFQGYRKLTTRIEELYASLETQYQRQRAAELKSLQMMINPHFLYNTLDQINWAAIEAGQSKISSMLSHIAAMFRLALSNSDSLVTVHEEVSHIRSYLQFQQIRWENRLMYTIEVEEGLRHGRMPKVLLQPFIENAFVHGFHGKPNAELSVRVYQNGRAMEIAICDNGKGLKPDWNSATRKKGGHGLRNVQERIEALFGPGYGFQLSNRAEGGTLVLIRLPIRTEAESLEGVLKHVENRDRG